MKLEEIQKNAAISGLEPVQAARIFTTEPLGDSARTVYYKTADGTLRERMLFRTLPAPTPQRETPLAGRRAGDAISGVVRSRILAVTAPSVKRRACLPERM